MNAVWLLMGLLMLAYIGSFLVGGGGRANRGLGLPSGVEYLVLGFVIGPKALGWLEGSALEIFDPFAHVALGWLMFVVGATYGVTGARRVRARRLVGGWIVALLTGALVSAVVWLFLVTWSPPIAPRDRLVIAGGVGAVAAETTRHAVRWVVERYRAVGPVAELISEIAEGDDLVPLLATAVLFAFAPPAHLAIDLPRWSLVALTLGLGVVLGALTAALLGRTFRLAETWSVLLGIALFAAGISGRLGLATVTTMFALGLTLSALSPHRAELAAMLAPTEQPVILPALVLAGAHVDFGAAPYLPFVIAVAIGARVLGKWLAGLGIVALSRDARPVGGRLGLGLLSAGALSMSLGLAFALRFPGAIGAVVLATSAGVTLFGELVGPASLRVVLARAGEVRVEPPPAPPSAPTGEAA